MQTAKFSVFYDSPDYDEALKFYRDTLRWRVLQTYTHPGRRGAILQVRDGVELELIGPAEGEAQTKPPPQGMRLRLQMDTTELCEAEYHRMKRADVDMIEDVKRHPWGETSFGIRTPDGLTIYIYALDGKQVV